MRELAEIQELLREILVKQAEHATEQKSLIQDVEQIKHVLLEGNGSPPLTAQVLTNRLKIDRLEEERLDKKVPRSVWLGIVLSSVVGVAGVIAALV